jgi:nitroreductase
MSQDMRQLISDRLSWRYAVRKFDPKKKISDADWKVLEESLRLAPSSYNLQPWKYFVVRDPALREKLRAASWNQAQVTDCSHFVVITHITKLDTEHIDKYIEKVSQIRGLSPEILEKMKNTMIRDLIAGPRSETIHHWAEKQTYIGMGMIMAMAAMMGIDTCPMEGLDPRKYDNLLGLEGTGWQSVAAVACGYRDPSDAFAQFKKVRFEPREIFTHL